MQNLTPSQLDGFAREVAGQIAQGYSFEQVLSNLDLASHELDEIFDSEEFERNLAEHGESAVESFKETRASSRAGSFHRKVSERFDMYYEQLHELAMSKSLKPEKRTDVLLKLIAYVAPASDIAVEPVRMPPDLVENWVKRNIEYYEAEEKQGRENSNPFGVGTSERDATASEAEPVLLREQRDADDGPDSGAAPAVRKLHTDDPVERGSRSELKETGMDAARALQILNRVRGISTVAPDSRPEHIDSTD